LKRKQRIEQLAWREYLPLAVNIVFWIVIVLAIGHADAARLLAAVTMVRGAQLLTKCATPVSVKRRAQAAPDVQRQTRWFAFNVQAAALIAGLVVIALLVQAMQWIGQERITGFLPFIALGMPARYLRLSDVGAASPFYRLTIAAAGLGLACLSWAAGLPVALTGLVFGVREWIAYAALRVQRRTPPQLKSYRHDPLRFEEVAQNSALYGRRMLTYRLSKVMLAILGPLGSAAARTGRGLQWHKRMEPYLPHHLGGFFIFTAATWGGAILLALRSSEPAALVVVGGLFQVGAAAANVLLFWRWMPPPAASATLEIDDEDNQ
jgi:hypothetical protein